MPDTEVQLLAGEPGFEPGQTESEYIVLPLQANVVVLSHGAPRTINQGEGKSDRGRNQAQEGQEAAHAPDLVSTAKPESD